MHLPVPGRLVAHCGCNNALHKVPTRLLYTLFKQADLKTCQDRRMTGWNLDSFLRLNIT